MGDGKIIEGLLTAQYFNNEVVDTRKTIRNHKGKLVTALTYSLFDEQKGVVSAKEIANEIRTIFCIEYKDRGVYREMEANSLVRKVSKALKEKKESLKSI